MANDVAKADGQTSWSGGVNSIKPTTIASQQTPDGVGRNELCWLLNGTVRDGGISPRPGYSLLGVIHPGNTLYQGGFMYDPRFGFPYLVLSIGGEIFKVDPDNASQPVSLSNQFFVPKIVVPGLTLKSNTNNLAGQIINVDPTSIAATQYNLPSGWIWPPIGQTVFVPTASDYTGPVGVTIPISYAFQVVSNSFSFVNNNGTGSITLKNLAAPGGVIFSGGGPSEDTGWAYNGFTTPAIGSNVTVQITRTHGPFIAPPSAGTTLHFYFGSALLLQVTKANTGGSGINPANLEQFYFAQAEEFLIIQAGDYNTPALFWDGVKLRRSIGINDTAVAPGTPGVNEIPPAGPMDYFQGRLWYGQGRQYSAGDIVGGNSGTAQYDRRDAVLNVTENPLVVGGDGFKLPSEAGNIRALKHSANLDATLGQGSLFIGTRKAMYKLSVPVSRSDWIAANNNNQPLQTVVQINNGPVNDRSIIVANGDLFYKSIEPSIRSLIVAIRYFNQWGNVDISARERRMQQFEDRALLHGVSGVNSANRALMSALPRSTAQGIVSDGIIPLDFIPVSDLQNSGAVPSWEGGWDSLSILQLFTGDFGGLERTFAVTVSKVDSSIQLWEISENFRSDIHAGSVAAALTGQEPETRITMVVETPAYTWGNVFEMKELVAGELWIDRVYGESVVSVDYRQDASSCWLPWHKFTVCQPRNSCELVESPVCYPIEQFGESFRQTIMLPKPQEKCEVSQSRPSTIGYMFQARITVKGYLRIRGFLMYGLRRDKALYENLQCP